ncbi:hypothetical protein ZEAMMB73_Zm00001d039402 [Zea mays]|jgi:hypothetical protein|uniref:Retrotransposon gag domain-containing protein n=1 Tax=Zea mays TaxID=4577 RepID=A0A1D6MG86_MAIZE|nr:hypothetical protein ZEAMMB73_Zm00001d039402 [Zea mays]
MGRASADPSTSRHGTPARRRRHFFRHRSPTPSIDGMSQELSPSHTATSFLEQPSFIPAPYDYDDGDVMGSYVAVAPLPVFRGDPGERPDVHLARFDRVRLANGAATPAAAARIFPASLDADAALWYDIRVSGADVNSPVPPWHAVRAAFLDFFRPPGAADRARAELAALRQGPGEAVNRYHLRLQGVLRRCSGVGFDVPNALSKAAFIDGLLAEFKDWVKPQHPEELDDAVALALSWERAEGVREAWRVAKAACAPAPATPTVVRCSLCGADGHEEARCEARRSGVVAEEEGGGSGPLSRLGSAVSTRSAQCQCRRHRCGKKAVAPSEVAGDGDASGAPADKPSNQLAGLVNLMRSLRS